MLGCTWQLGFIIWNKFLTLERRYERRGAGGL